MFLDQLILYKYEALYMATLIFHICHTFRDEKLVKLQREVKQIA